MSTSYYFISNYMNKKWFFFFALLFIGNLSFGQTFLFKYNTGVTYKTNYSQSCNAKYISLTTGSSPSWITLVISSVSTNGLAQFLGPNEGKFLVLNPQGTLYLNVPWTNLGVSYALSCLPSPTGSFVLSGWQYTTNSQGNLTNTVKNYFYKYNSTSKSWSSSTNSLPSSTVGGAYNWSENGTQANCALWCSLQNEGGNLVAYVYSY
jgi:hypothetical protein